jgi:tight adherence protein B
MTNDYIFVALAFVAGFMVVAGINMLVFDLADDRRRQLRQKLSEETRLRQAERARNSMGNYELYELTAEGFVDPESELTILDRMRRFLTQAGLSATPSQIFLMAVGLALLSGASTWYMTHSILIAITIAMAFAAIPFLLVHFLLIQRRRKLLSQLPDAYEMMSRVLKAGQTISQAIRGVADEFSSPLAEEFAFCWEQQNLGLSPEASLRELARRTGILELKIFVVALMIHRQTGGNLSHLLHKLSMVIREREKMRGKIGALTAEGKFQAYILIGLPFFVGGVISLINPTYMEPMLEFPVIFVIAGGLLVAGTLWMQRIINFDF